MRLQGCVYFTGFVRILALVLMIDGVYTFNIFKFIGKAMTGKEYPYPRLTESCRLV